MDHNLLILSPLEGYLRNTALTISLQVLCKNKFSFLLCSYMGVRFLSHDKYMSKNFKNCLIIF